MILVPMVRITLGGQDITSGLIPAPFGLPLEGGGLIVPSGFGSGLNSAPLMSLTVTDNEGTKSDTVELEIDNRGRYPAPPEGSTLQVWLGLKGASPLRYMGKYTTGTWTKSGGLRKLSVSAKAAEMTSDIKAAKSRSYHEETVGGIVNKIAGKHGLSAQVHGDLAKIKIGHIDQSNESDVNFLTRLAKRVGAKFKLADGRVIFNKPGSDTLPAGGATPLIVIPERGLIDWTATSSERGEYDSASAAFQNTQKGEREWITKGSGKLQFRDRKLYKTREEAEAAATSQLESLKRGKVSLTLNMVGRPDMMAGAKVAFTIDDPDVAGTYIVKTATHTLDNDGLKTSVQCESESGGKSSGKSSAKE